MLKAFDLVPEAYPQRFRTWKKDVKQSHLEFAPDLNPHFNRWCSTAEVDELEGLCDLIVLEQFKNSTPVCVATYISEQKVEKPAEAAALADDYVLTHRVNFGEPRMGFGSRDSVAAGGMESSSRCVTIAFLP